MAICYVGLGGNTGDVREAFRESLRQLRSRGLEATSLSGLYRTAAVGQHAGPAFLNAAVQLQTTLEPEPLLDVLQDIERVLGRTRELHWGPRTMDLDLLMFADRVLDSRRLTLPHPACWYRRFVLDPLAEMASDVRHPERRLTVTELRDRLRQRPLPIVLMTDDAILKEQLTVEVSRRFGDQVEIGDVQDSSRKPVLAFCLSEGPCETVPRASLLRVAAESGDVANTVVDVIQAAIDTPVRIASPTEWNSSAV